MSAFIVTGTTMQNLATAMCWLYGNGGLQENVNAGLALLGEANVASLKARYGKELGAYSAPEHTDGLSLPSIPMRTSPVQVLKSIQCMEYQCCEVEDWRNTEASKLLDAMKDAAINRLDGYGDARWD